MLLLLLLGIFGPVVWRRHGGISGRRRLGRHEGGRGPCGGDGDVGRASREVVSFVRRGAIEQFIRVLSGEGLRGSSVLTRVPGVVLGCVGEGVVSKSLVATTTTGVFLQGSDVDGAGFLSLVVWFLGGGGGGGLLLGVCEDVRGSPNGVAEEGVP